MFSICCYLEYWVNVMNDVEKRRQVFQPGDWEDGDISRKKKKAGERASQGLDMWIHGYQHKAEG